MLQDQTEFNQKQKFIAEAIDCIKVDLSSNILLKFIHRFKLFSSLFHNRRSGFFCDHLFSV